MSRIPYPDYEKLSPVKRELVEKLGKHLLNVSRMAMHAPDEHWMGQRQLGQAQLRHSSFSGRIREIVIMRVAHISKSEYELYHHLSIARNEGFTDAELAAVAVSDPTPFNEVERAVMRFADEVIANVSPSDEALAEVRKHFPDSQVMELVMLIGSYMITARVAAVSGADLDGHQVAGWSSVPTDDSVRTKK